jgi:hypothetical protein
MRAKWQFHQTLDRTILDRVVQSSAKTFCRCTNGPVLPSVVIEGNDGM